MNNLEIFSNKADNYKRYRPPYSDEAINFLFDNSILDPTDTVADIGSGTGLFASQIIGRVQSIYGVEPNEQMRNEAQNAFINEPKYIPVNGTAENTQLSSGSVDAVSAAQAFHWFDPVRFRDECKRILKTNGPVILIWNRKTPCQAESERRKIIAKYDSVVDTYDYSWEKRIQGIEDFFSGNVKYKEFDCNLTEDFDSFIGRTLSSSHSIDQDSPLFDAYISDWRSYFDRFSENGIITIMNKTVLYWGVVPSVEN